MPLLAPFGGEPPGIAPEGGFKPDGMFIPAGGVPPEGAPLGDTLAWLSGCMVLFGIIVLLFVNVIAIFPVAVLFIKLEGLELGFELVTDVIFDS
jgi:hypothetical protein